MEMSTVWAILGPLIASGIGGWFGMTLGLRKYRGEKAFDRRADWSESLYHATMATIFALDEVASGAKHIGEARGAIDKFTELSAYSTLYGSGKLGVWVDRAGNKLQSLIARSEAGEQGPQMIQELTDELCHFADAVAEEFRRHLGIRRLKKYPLTRPRP